jgi:hypothetical protein
MNPHDTVGVITALRAWEIQVAENTKAFDEKKIHYPLPWVDAINARLIVDLASSELVPDHFIVYQGGIVAGAEQMVEVDRDVGQTFSIAYSSIDVSRLYDVRDRVEALQEADAQLAAYPLMFDALKVELSPISFGKPLSVPAEEQGLKIPPSISRRYDVYWLEFALSLREIRSSDVEEVLFDVRFPNDVIALELIPLLYGKERQVVQSESTPPITVAGRGAAVTIGEFYKQTVTFTTLEPTIVAVGLRESNVAWRLRDEAIRLGSQKFIAIVGVPKDAR